MERRLVYGLAGPRFESWQWQETVSSPLKSRPPGEWEGATPFTQWVPQVLL